MNECYRCDATLMDGEMRCPNCSAPQNEFSRQYYERAIAAEENRSNFFVLASALCFIAFICGVMLTLWVGSSGSGPTQAEPMTMERAVGQVDEEVLLDLWMRGIDTQAPLGFRAWERPRPHTLILELRTTPPPGLERPLWEELDDATRRGLAGTIAANYMTFAIRNLNYDPEVEPITVIFRYAGFDAPVAMARTDGDVRLYRSPLEGR